MVRRSSTFSTTLAPFLNLGAGSSLAFDVSMLTSTSGLFAESYSLALSDEDKAGRELFISWLRELDLAEDDCCMWERFVVDPAVRTIQLIRDFCAKLIESSRYFGYQYAGYQEWWAADCTR